MPLRRRAVCLGLGTLPGLARAAAPAAPARRVLRLATGTEPQSADGRWLRDAYTLALEPLGYR